MDNTERNASESGEYCIVLYPIGMFSNIRDAPKKHAQGIRMEIPSTTDGK